MLGLQVQNVYKFPFVVLEFVSVPHDQNLFILVCNFMDKCFSRKCLYRKMSTFTIPHPSEITGLHNTDIMRHHVVHFQFHYQSEFLQFTDF